MTMLTNSFVYSAGGGVAGPWTLTIAAGEVASDLTNFPVYVNLADMPPEFWGDVLSDGANIRVKQSGSVIPFDIVKIDTGTSTGVLFFLASSLLAASDNIFTIDLSGGSLIASGDPNGRDDVWAAYDWVYLGEQSGGAGDVFIDRTGGAAGARSGGTTSSITSSPISLGAGCGVDIADSSTARIQFADRPQRTVFTFAVTAQTDVNIGVNMAAASYVNDARTVAVSLYARNRSPNDHWAAIDSTNSWINTDTTPHVAANTPCRAVTTYNGTTSRKFYGNGALVTNDTTVTAISGMNDISLGAGWTGGDPFNGKVAFAYLRAEELSADFIAAEYSNLNAPASFYTIS